MFKMLILVIAGGVLDRTVPAITNIRLAAQFFFLLDDFFFRPDILTENDSIVPGHRPYPHV